MTTKTGTNRVYIQTELGSPLFTVNMGKPYLDAKRQAVVLLDIADTEQLEFDVGIIEAVEDLIQPAADKGGGAVMHAR